MRVIKDFWMSSYYSDKIAFYNELISFVFIVGASMTLAITAVVYYEIYLSGLFCRKFNSLCSLILLKKISIITSWLFLFC